MQGLKIDIEQRVGSEVKGFGTLDWSAEGILSNNPASEITPAELITALVTENGVLIDPNSEKIQNLCFN